MANIWTYHEKGPCCIVSEDCSSDYEHGEAHKTVQLRSVSIVLLLFTRHAPAWYDVRYHGVCLFQNLSGWYQGPRAGAYLPCCLYYFFLDMLRCDALKHTMFQEGDVEEPPQTTLFVLAQLLQLF